MIARTGPESAGGWGQPALSFEHRIIASELDSLFLRDVNAMLADSLRMLVWS